MTDQEKARRLAESGDMTPVEGTVDVDIPIDVLWESFSHPNLWARWNRCFFWGRNRELKVGEHLIWAFEPIRAWYLYKLWSIANIVEVEAGKKATWEVTAFPGMYARHTYHMEDLGNGRTRFGSWEQAMGPGFRLLRKFWVAHFTFVKDESLIGAARLNGVYKRTGALDEAELPQKSYAAFAVAMALTAVLVAALIGAGWFWASYVRVTEQELAPGVHALMGGGGNSLVVEDGGEAMVVDTKFEPGAGALRRWIAGHITSPVRRVVNTHYHYDHTQGNSLYPEARKIAHRTAPALMRRFDADWWDGHGDGVPVALVDEETSFRMGATEVRLEHPPAAHTAGDLYVFLPRQNVVATGDLVFHTYYPFMDQPEGGTSIPGMIETVRALVRAHPDATFLPGHGPVARAADLTAYAGYLEALYKVSVRAHKEGLGETAAAEAMGGWTLRWLPSYHHGRLIWATRTNAARWAYGLSTSTSEIAGVFGDERN